MSRELVRLVSRCAVLRNSGFPALQDAQLTKREISQAETVYVSMCV